ncbi:MAG TPA: lipocalin family protein [Ignavibacteria bacterium]|nr:lipocalin family protein [Ignavibacteria bacterium]
MKIILFILFLFAVSFHGCGKVIKNISTKDSSANVKKYTAPVKMENLWGKWVNDGDQMGFEIKMGGKAASINMPALDYNYWKLDGHKLILNSTAKNVSNPVATDQIFIIRELTPSKLIVSPVENQGTWWTYTKQN